MILYRNANILIIGDENNNTTIFHDMKMSCYRSVEDLLELETDQETHTFAEKTNGKTYLEAGLPESIQRAIKDYIFVQNF